MGRTLTASILFLLADSIAPQAAVLFDTALIRNLPSAARRTVAWRRDVPFLVFLPYDTLHEKGRATAKEPSVSGSTLHCAGSNDVVCFGQIL